MINYIKKLLFLLLLILLLLPELANKTKLIKLNPLNGVCVLEKEPTFSDSGWFENNFQAQFEKYYNQQAGLHDFFIRIKNQIDYSFFNIANIDNLIIGKEGYLFEKKYINAYLGNDFVGKKKIDEKVIKTKQLQDALKKKNIDLIILLAPGKGSFYLEYIPSNYNIASKKISNYDYILSKLKQLHVNHIDFNNYFLSLKKNSKYPLIPKCGTHWSYYGATFAADTLNKYMQQIKGIIMPKMEWKIDKITKTTIDPDNDLENLMNLLFDIDIPFMAYPLITYVKNNYTVKPHVLFIGDSFYWNLQNSGITDSLFDKPEFWYYNHDIYRQNIKINKTVAQINANEIIDKQDFIIILNTDGLLDNLGYGFVEMVLTELNTNPDAEQALINKYILEIKSNPDWIIALQKKAKERNITFEEMICIDARYMISEKNKESLK